MRGRLLWFVNLLVVMLLAGNAMAEKVFHEVKDGEILYGIAKKYGVTVEAIQKINPIIKDINIIHPRWRLEIPARESIISKPPSTSSKAEEKKKSDDTIVETGDKKAEAKPVSVKAEARKAKSKVAPKKVAQKLPPIDFYEPGKAGIRKGSYTKPGVAPTKMSDEEAFDYLRLSDEVKQKLHQSIKEGKGVPAYIRPGDQFLMTYGWNGIVDADLKYHSQLAAKQYLIEDSKGIVHDIRYIEWCHNWTRYPEPPKVVKTPKSPPVTSTPTPSITPVVPPVVKTPPPENPCLDNWDMYLGGGNYLNRVEPKYNYGYYFWLKYRNRPCPFWYTPEENYLGIQNVGFGFVGFVAGGKGTAARHYKYNWLEGTIGGTAKVYTPHADYDFDVMAGQLRNKGSWQGNKDRDQIDSIFLLSAHANQYREGENVKWFPKREFNGEWRIPFHTKMKKGTKVDNEVIEASYTQWIYKFQVGGDDDSFNLSPGFYFGVGYEKASDDPSFVKIGPALEISSYNNVVAGVSLFHYKFQGDGQWHPFGAYVSPDGVLRAYDASQITPISEEELRGLENGSKLLRNPADFL